MAKTAGFLAAYVALGIIAPEKLNQNSESTFSLQPPPVEIPAWNHLSRG